MNKRRRESRKSWHEASPTIVYAAVPALLIGAFLAMGVQRDFQGNWSALFYFGDTWRRGALPRNAFVGVDGGYDGQFYYRVARDPFLPFVRLGLGAGPDRGLGIDMLSYRYRRIAYPLAARLAAFGTTDGLVWSFPLVSVLGVWLGVFCTSGLFETFGWRRWWGVAYAMLPGIAFSACRNLGEGVAISVVSAALLAIAKKRTAPAIALLTIAHLAHETTILVSIGCFAQAFWRPDGAREAAPYLLPIAVTLLWAAILAAAFTSGLGVFLFPPENLGVPLGGLWHKLRWLFAPEYTSPAYAYLPRSGRFWTQEGLLVTPILLALGVLFKAAWTRDTETWLTGLLVSLFVLTFGDPVWQDAASYARVTSLALLLALRSVAEAPSLAGYAFLASLPLGTVAALGWCADNWRGWSLT